MEDLYSVPSRYPKLLSTVRSRGTNSSNVLDFFSATDLSLELSKHFGGDASHETVLRLPPLQPRGILPTMKSSMPRDPSIPEAVFAEVRQDWRAISEKNLYASFQLRREEGLFAASLKTGRGVDEYLKTTIRDANTRLVAILVAPVCATLTDHRANPVIQIYSSQIDRYSAVFRLSSGGRSVLVRRN